MADATKYAPINGGTLFSDFKSHFYLPRTKKSVAFAYGFMFAFIAFTIFLAFSPSPNSSSPWFTDIFSRSFSSSSSASTTATTPIFSQDSYRSHFSSIFSYFFPNSTSEAPPDKVTRSPNNTFGPAAVNKEPPPSVQNQARNQDSSDKVGVLQPDKVGVLQPNQTAKSPLSAGNKTVDTSKASLVMNNQTQKTELSDQVGVLKPNQTVNSPPKSSSDLNKESPVAKDKTGSDDLHGKADQSTNALTKANQTVNSSSNSGSGEKSANGNGEKKIAEKGVNITNLTSSLLKKQNDKTDAGKNGSEDLIKSLTGCNFFDGNWVRDESYPLYKPGSCSLIDEQFNCYLNGRSDNAYHKLKWKPKACTLPRLDGSHMLELLRGKRLVFVGDSLNRNMWESLICILRNSVKDQSKVYEASGRHHFRAEASYSFIFQDYNCTVEFFASPFLVQEWEVSGKDGKKKETLRLDLIGRTADLYKNGDIIVFNTGHWWTHEKTSKGQDYYQEGSHVYSELSVDEAFRRAITTWARWVDANVNPTKSFVFFRGYSASHFSGGQWNSGGQCDHETEPIKNETYLSQYPPKMTILERVLKGMQTRVSYLNITRMTDYRKDGHPSVYRKQNLSEEERRSPLRFQDCSHWCLPGVPDAWNELLYAELLVKMHQRQQQQQKRS